MWLSGEGMLSLSINNAGSLAFLYINNWSFTLISHHIQKSIPVYYRYNYVSFHKLSLLARDFHDLKKGKNFLNKIKKHPI